VTLPGSYSKEKTTGEGKNISAKLITMPAFSNLLFRKQFSSRGLLLFVCLSLLTACSTAPDTKVMVPVSLAENIKLPSRVAILPFRNNTSDPESAVQVRRIFYNYFSSLNYRDSELYTVDSVFKQNNWSELIAKGAQLPWKNICEELNVDGFITGTVNEFGKMYAVLYAQTEVSLAIELHSCVDGSSIWQQQGKETKRDGDIPFSPTGLAAALVSTYIKHQDISVLEISARLSLRLTLSMPNPPSLLPIPPEISLFVHNAQGRLLLPGEVLKVVLLGDPGNEGYWSIPKLSKRMRLAEKEPGIYVGQYTIKPEDRILGSYLEAFLVSDQQAETRWLDVLQPVSLGQPTVLPGVISDDMTLSPDQSPYLIADIVLVNQGVQLTILAGTSIWSAGAGLLVNGQLIAAGESDNRISLKSLSDTPWKGLTLNQTSAPSRLHNVVISDADIALNAYQAEAEINGLLLENNQWGIVAQNSVLDIKNSSIQHSQNVGISGRMSRINLSSNYIAYNKVGGLQAEESEVAAKNNAIYANGNWNVRNLDGSSVLDFGQNWWGTGDKDKVKTVGKVTFEPLLQNNPQLPFQ